MYYHLWDYQANNYLHTGRNSESIGDLREPFLSYLSVDHEKKELKKFAKMDMLELANMFDFEVQQTKEKI